MSTGSSTIQYFNSASSTITDLDVRTTLGVATSTPARGAVFGVNGDSFFNGDIVMGDSVGIRSRSGDMSVQAFGSGYVALFSDNATGGAFLNMASLSADRIFTFPDTAGTFCLTVTCASAATYPITLTSGTLTFPATSTLFANLVSGSLAQNAAGSIYLAATSTAGTGLTYTNGVFSVDLGTAIDISSETNLAVTSPVILTGDTLSFGWTYPLPNSATSTLITFSGGATFSAGTVTATGATVVDKVYVSYPYSTTTAWTGTTTSLQLGVEIVKKTWNSANCFTDAGTLNAQFYYIQTGTTQVKMNMLAVTTSTSTQTLSTNNAVPAGAKIFVDYGTPASSPNRVVCSIDKTRNL